MRSTVTEQQATSATVCVCVFSHLLPSFCLVSYHRYCIMQRLKRSHHTHTHTSPFSLRLRFRSGLRTSLGPQTNTELTQRVLTTCATPPWNRVNVASLQARIAVVRGTMGDCTRMQRMWKYLLVSPCKPQINTWEFSPLQDSPENSSSVKGSLQWDVDGSCRRDAWVYHHVGPHKPRRISYLRRSFF